MSLCEHFEPGSYPLAVDLIIDEHLGLTEGLVHCRICGAPYLLEMLDWQGNLRLFRVGAPEPDAVRGLLKDLSRGSCDLNRAGEEVRQFSLSSRRLPELLLIDMNARSIVMRTELRDPHSVPGAAWRDLPCDGSRIAALQSARL